MKKEAIAKIAELVKVAEAALKEAEALAKKNKIPFDFQIATMVNENQELAATLDEDGYAGDEYVDVDRPIVVSSDTYRREGWNSSSLSC